MAHFDYPPGTPTGVVPPLYVLPSTDWAYTIAQLFKAVNGDDGGTWAPGAFITIGGAGVQFTGTAHELAGSARLTLQSLAEIRIEDGAAIRANGGGSGDIFLQVVSNVAKLTVNSGAVAQVLSGGALDMFGSLTLKSTGTMTADSGSFITLSSGSTLTQASGGTINVNGAVNLKTGSVVTAESGSLVSFQSGALVSIPVGVTFSISTTISGSPTFSGSVTHTGSVTHSGSGGRTVHRATRDLDPNADEDITVADDACRVALTLGAVTRNYTVRHTGTVPTDGERIYVVRSGPTTPGNQTAYIKREDGTVIFTFANGKQGFCLLEFDGSNWTLLAANLVSSGTSGWFGDTW